MNYLRFFAPENQELLHATETVDTLLRLAEIPDTHPHDLTAVIGPDTERAIYPGLCASFVLVDATGYYDDESWIMYVSQDITHEGWRYWVRDDWGDTWHVDTPSKVAEELEREMIGSLNKWKAWHMTKMANAELLETQLHRPWTRELTQDGDVVAARIVELDGCFSEGSSMEEALANLQEALELWLEAAIESGAHVPEPRAESWANDD